MLFSVGSELAFPMQIYSTPGILRRMMSLQEAGRAFHVMCRFVVMGAGSPLFSFLSSPARTWNGSFYKIISSCIIFFIKSIVLYIIYN